MVKNVKKVGNKIIVGLIESVTIYGNKMKVKTTAKFDTGAQRSSIDQKIADKLGLGTVIKFVRIKSASAGKNQIRRPVFKAEIEIEGRRLPVEFNTTDRSHLKQKILIGRDLIHSNFVVDVAKSNKSHLETDLR